MFYEYDQNNSRGTWVEDIKQGISHYVIIEADSPKEADGRAEQIGLYFDGCNKGIDCPCCGDRWYGTYDGKGTEKPTHYGESLYKTYKDKNIVGLRGMMVWDGADKLFVHYKDGTIAQYQQTKEKFKFIQEIEDSTI